MKPRTAKTAKTNLYGATNGTTYNLANYSGSAGRVKSLQYYLSAGLSNLGYFKLTIDGVVIASSVTNPAGLVSFGNGYYSLVLAVDSAGNPVLCNPNDSTGDMGEIDVEFKSSFSLDFVCTANVGATNFYNVAYYETE